jgi:hypothetical protein
MNEASPSRLAISRTLLLGWCVWLLVSWSINVSLFPARKSWMLAPDGALLWRAAAEAFVPMVRGMLMSLAAGLMLIWPAWRLTFSSSEAAGRETTIDWAALWLVAQVVVWPVRLLADFSLGRLLAMDAAIAIWGAAAALAVWLGRRSESSIARAAAMITCAILAVGAWPAANWTGRPELAGYSPLHVLWALCESQADERQVIANLAGVLIAVMAAWLTALMILRTRQNP